MRRTLSCVCVAALFVVIFGFAGPGGAQSSDATPAIVSAANAFLGTLSATEKAAVQFDFSDTAQKQRWSNLPQGLYQRAGLMWGNLSTAAQNAWLALMQATLSTNGYNRVRAEWRADDELAAQGGSYGQQYYWVAIIGSPSGSSPWQWQFGGHHVTINATVNGSKLSLTPSFIGAQPTTYTNSGSTVRPLGDIEDDAYALVSSLDSTQRQAAVLGTTSIDLVLGPGQDGKTIQSEGLPGSSMTAAQQTILTRLVGYYGGLANDEDASSRLSQLSADLANTYFAWYGPTTGAGSGYFRVTGPHVVIELSPQQMGGDPANHLHGIYRDPTDDYGGLLGTTSTATTSTTAAAGSSATSTTAAAGSSATSNTTASTEGSLARTGGNGDYLPVGLGAMALAIAIGALTARSRQSR